MELMAPVARPRNERIEDALVRNFRENGECWEWSASVMKVGYGQFRASRSENLYVHRMAYELLVGPLSYGEHLHHICENKICFNPDHLEVTTNSEHSRIHSSPTCLKCGGSRWSIVKPHNWRRCMDCHTRNERERRSRH